MKSTNKIMIKLKKYLPAVLAVLVIGMLTGLAFLPMSVDKKSRARSFDDGVIRDDEAMRVLGCCAAYAYSHDFTAELNGTIKASVFGIPYSFTVTGGRTVDGEKFCDVKECRSAFIKTAVKYGFDGDAYTVSTGEYAKENFEYGKSRTLTKSEFLSGYGTPNIGLSRYALDNAVIQADRIGENEYRYVLDAHRAAQYCGNEVKTLLKCDKPPEYQSIELTVVGDGERAVKVTSREKFRIDKFGGTHCTVEFCEVFEY